jgi:ATP-dependent exoDNAse (exonuclease V) alpha subunit
LVPVNKKSPLSRKAINAMLQELLNPNGKRVDGNPFRVGDKLICNKNHWLPFEKEWMKEVLEFNGKETGDCQGITITLELPTGGNVVMRDSRIYVANGEQSAVLGVEPLRTTVKLSSPERVLVVPRGQGNKDESDDECEKEESSGCNWELGLAISCHKSQGSSWKVVIMLADEYPGARMVQSKQYLITALSRIETFFVGIGKKHVADQMCKQDALFNRKTFLAERIAELRAGSRQPDQSWDDSFFSELLDGVCS